MMLYDFAFSFVLGAAIGFWFAVYARAEWGWP
jgi:hypothetical protein